MNVPDRVASAKQLFEGGELERAYARFLGVAIDEAAGPELRVEAWLAMGAIVFTCPHLSPDDSETGVMFYRAAVALDPKSYAGWWNILQEYGPDAGRHQDVELARRAAREVLEACDREDPGAIRGDRSFVLQVLARYPELRVPSAGSGSLG